MVEDFLLDVSRLVWRGWAGRLPTGIDRTCLAYIRHYGPNARAVVQRGGMTRILSKKASQRLFVVLLEANKLGIRKQLLQLLPAFLLARSNARRWSGSLYLNVGHTGLDRPGHAHWLKKTQVRPIYFVHDLIPLTHPEYCRSSEPDKHMRRMHALLSNGLAVIGNSRDTLHELATFSARQASLKMPSSLVAPLGADMNVQHAPWKASSFELPARPYFVMLGTIEGRKNHLLMLNIWAEMVRRLGQACPLLVIIGQRGWESEQTVDMLERNETIRGHVIELAQCDDTQLTTYMANAEALLFPSFVEGYGLPLVEALANGTPVIASDLAVFRELAGNIPDYLSPIDGLGWMETIEDYSRPNSKRRSAQIARLSGWQAPTWEAHFARVDQWLKQFQPAPE